MTENAIAQALEWASQGNAHRAVALLEAAAQKGDSVAAMQLAVWYLAGANVPRDFARAGEWLRRAVTIGHVDGALMEIALTGNGYGGRIEPDWAAAVRLLDRAAANDPVAAQQRDLLATMAPEADIAPKVLSRDPRVVVFERLFTPDECAHIALVGSELLEPAFVLDPATGRSMPHLVRTSDSGAIGPAKETLVVRRVNQRIARATGTNIEQGEPLTVLRYRPGQQYRPHLDTITGATNQRCRTALLYLNHGFGGGETIFPRLGLSVSPRIGDLLVFDTTLPDGRPDERTVHAGKPVTAGTKWLATRWIREQPVDPWTLR